jgi:hypothetical protein
MKNYENLIYGVGAAIVIMGALFKIQNWTYGSEILTFGMIVEAGIFLYSAFIPVEDIQKETENLVIHTPAVKRYNEQVSVAVNNIEDLNKMYEQQLEGFSETTGMSDKLKEVNMHLESLSSVYRSILKTMKS